MATHNERPHSCLPPQKQTYQRIAFHDSMILLSGIVSFGFVSFFGGGGGLHVAHITIGTSGEPHGAHVPSPDMRLKCRVCLSLRSGKCDHMAVSSRPPRVDGRVSLFSFVFFVLWRRKKKKKNVVEFSTYCVTISPADAAKLDVPQTLGGLTSPLWGCCGAAPYRGNEAKRSEKIQSTHRDD